MQQLTAHIGSFFPLYHPNPFLHPYLLHLSLVLVALIHSSFSSFYNSTFLTPSPLPYHLYTFHNPCISPISSPPPHCLARTFLLYSLSPEPKPFHQFLPPTPLPFLLNSYTPSTLHLYLPSSLLPTSLPSLHISFPVPIAS